MNFKLTDAGTKPKFLTFYYSSYANRKGEVAEANYCNNTKVFITKRNKTSLKVIFIGNINTYTLNKYADNISLCEKLNRNPFGADNYSYYFKCCNNNKGKLKEYIIKNLLAIGIKEDINVEVEAWSEEINEIQKYF